jgi:hypothetical protein
MSKTNDTSKLITLDNQLDDHNALADSELEHVSGGRIIRITNTRVDAQPLSGGASPVMI